METLIMNVTISQSKYRLMIINLCIMFVINMWLGYLRFSTLSNSNKNLKALHKGNIQIYQEITKATNLLIDNSDLMMRFSHYQNHHDPSVKKHSLCPECYKDDPRVNPPEGSKSWKDFVLSDEEIIDKIDTMTRYTAKEAIYDSEEIRKQIGRICTSLVNQYHKLNYTLLKMRDADSVPDDTDIKVEVLDERPVYLKYQRAIEDKDGTEGLTAFNDAIGSNIRPELHNTLAPLVAAIRYAENGGAGREYGILHPNVKPTYRSQAGWCAATVQKNWDRYTLAGGDQNNIFNFIEILGNKYCPIDDPKDTMHLNQYWFGNVVSLYKKFI